MDAPPDLVAVKDVFESERRKDTTNFYPVRGGGSIRLSPSLVIGNFPGALQKTVKPLPRHIVGVKQPHYGAKAVARATSSAGVDAPSCASEDSGFVSRVSIAVRESSILQYASTTFS